MWMNVIDMLSRQVCCNPKHILVIDVEFEIILKWIPNDFKDDKSALV